MRQKNFQEHYPFKIDRIALDHGIYSALKGMDRIHQQTVIGTHSHVTQVKMQNRKKALPAAEMLNGYLPPFNEQGFRLMRMRPTEEARPLQLSA